MPGAKRGSEESDRSPRLPRSARSKQAVDKSAKPGKVFLLGAGPGDPKLLTLKACEILRRADVVVYDRLANPRVLEYASPQAELIYVGKARGSHSVPQDKIDKTLVKLAREGKLVARVKGGDPFVFGRGGEEALALVRAGIEFEVVPGVTSGIAVPAYAGIPVTHRGKAASVAFITGHEDPTKKNLGINWRRVANSTDTLVFFMGMQNLALIVSKLLHYGRRESEPVAVIRWGTTAAQRAVAGRLGNIVAKVAEADLHPPCIIVVGAVASLAKELSWFEKKPLFGKRVLITRTREQASSFAAKIEELGGEAVLFPTIKMVPPMSWASVDAAVRRLKTFDWVVLTSANAVDCFLSRVFAAGKDVRVLSTVKIAVVGEATARRLQRYGLRADLMPKTFQQEGLVEAFRRLSSRKGTRVGRVLIPQAEEVRDALGNGLTELGIKFEAVTVYRNVPDDSRAAAIETELKNGAIDILTFTSSSTVKNFLSLVPRALAYLKKHPATVVCIGPVTARTAEELGLKPDVVPEKFTLDAMVDALTAHYEANA